MASSSRSSKTSAAKPASRPGGKRATGSPSAARADRAASAAPAVRAPKPSATSNGSVKAAAFSPAARPKPRSLTGAEAVKAVLHDATPKARELAETLRRLVKKAAPDAVESADLKTNAIFFERKKPFCSITPAQEHVVMGFHRGSELDDPEAILTGSGKGARTIRVAQVHDIRGGAFERFVRQARELAGR